MEQHEQIDAFSFALDSLVDRYIAEFDLNINTIVGVIEEKKLELLLGKEVTFTPDESLLAEQAQEDRDMLDDEDDIFTDQEDENDDTYYN